MDTKLFTAIKTLNDLRKTLPIDEALEYVTKCFDITIDDLKSNDPVETENGDGLYLRFSTTDDVETALGILMYKQLPWKSKTDTKIYFDTIEILNSAKTELNRRFDFIDPNAGNCAKIVFDNIEDYQTVVRFMVDSGMAIVGENSDDLVNEINSPDFFDAYIKEDFPTPGTIIDNDLHSLKIVKRW